MASQLKTSIYHEVHATKGDYTERVSAHIGSGNTRLFESLYDQMNKYPNYNYSISRLLNLDQHIETSFDFMRDELR